MQRSTSRPDAKHLASFISNEPKPDFDVDDLSLEFIDPAEEKSHDDLSLKFIDPTEQKSSQHETIDEEKPLIKRVARNENVPDQKLKLLIQESSFPYEYRENEQKRLSQQTHDVRVNISPSNNNLNEPLLSHHLRNVTSDSDGEEKKSREMLDENSDPDQEMSSWTDHLTRRKLFAAILTLSLYFNATIEMIDGFSAVEGDVHLFPFPGDPEFLALLPNCAELQTAIISLIGLYTLKFDYANLVHGLDEILDSIDFDSFKLSLPSSWKELWETKRIPESKLHQLVGICFIVSALSIFNEIVNSLSMSDDNTEESEQQKQRVAGWLRWITSSATLNQVSAIMGNLAFLFCEAYKLPEVAVRLWTDRRGMEMTRVNCFNEEETYLVPYPLSYELITLPARLSGSIGAGLFALTAALNVFDSIHSLETKVSWFILINLHKSATAGVYDGEWHLEVCSRLFNTFDEIRKGIFPSIQEMVAFLMVTMAGGIPAYYQQKLTETYFEDLGGNDSFQNYFLAPLTLCYAILMWVNYSGSWYDPINHILTGARNKCATFFYGKPQADPRSDSEAKMESSPVNRTIDPNQSRRGHGKTEPTHMFSPHPSDATDRKDPENPALVTLSKTPGKKTTFREHIQGFTGWLGEKASHVRRAVCGKRPSEITDSEINDLTTETISTPAALPSTELPITHPPETVSNSSASALVHVQTTHLQRTHAAERTGLIPTACAEFETKVRAPEGSAPSKTQISSPKMESKKIEWKTPQKMFHLRAIEHKQRDSKDSSLITADMKTIAKLQLQIEAYLAPEIKLGIQPQKIFQHPQHYLPTYGLGLTHFDSKNSMPSCLSKTNKNPVYSLTFRNH